MRLVRVESDGSVGKKASRYRTELYSILERPSGILADVLGVILAGVLPLGLLRNLVKITA